MSDNFFNSLFDFLSKPISLGILIAFFMTSLTLLTGRIFLSQEIINNLGLSTFYEQYMPLVLITFFISFFLLIAQLVPMLYKKYQNIKAKKNLEKIHKELFEDPDCQKILLELYRQRNNPVLLPEHNQKVILMRQSGMIIRVTNQIMGSAYDLMNPKFPYVLQTFTEKKIKEKLEQK